MKGGGEVDPGAKTMRHDTAIGDCGHLGYLPADREAAAESNIGLDDMQAALNEALEIPVCHIPFTGSDGDG